MKVVGWNVEWMNNWFVGNNQVALRNRFEPQGRPEDAIPDVDALCRRVAQTIKDMSPDILCVQEGPSDIAEMELFISKCLRDPAGNNLYLTDIVAAVVSIAVSGSIVQCWNMVTDRLRRYRFPTETVL